METNKLFGSVLIIIGTMVGAGMLALPMISAGAGFTSATILLVFAWILMTLTGLYTLEVNLAFPTYSNSFSSMSFAALGNKGKTIAWICILLLLYSLASAYIVGNGSLINHLIVQFFHIKTSQTIDALIFIFTMGGIVYWSTTAVDYCNRFLLSIKGVLLVTTLILLVPQIDWINVVRPAQENLGHYFWPIIPIFLCSFGFQPTIPSLSNYLNREPKELKIAIILGSTITLVIYLLWLLVIMGTIPWEGEHSFTTLAQNSGSVGGFVKIIYSIANNKWVTIGINSFSNIAMTTSFLGVTLGLFDFLADGFKRPNTRFGRLQTAFLSFTPPFIFAIFYPNGFILALKYAALFATVLVIIFPPLMAMKLRKNKDFSSDYKVFGGQYLILTVITIGIVLIGIQVVSSFY